MIIIAANIFPIADANNQKLLRGDPINICNVEREHVRNRQKKDYYDRYKEAVLDVKQEVNTVDDSWWRGFQFDD